MKPGTNFGRSDRLQSGRAAPPVLHIGMVAWSRRCPAADRVSFTDPTVGITAFAAPSHRDHSVAGSALKAKPLDNSLNRIGPISQGFARWLSYPEAAA